MEGLRLTRAYKCFYKGTLGSSALWQRSAVLLITHYHQDYFGHAGLEWKIKARVSMTKIDVVLQLGQMPIYKTSFKNHQKWFTVNGPYLTEVSLPMPRIGFMETTIHCSPISIHWKR